MRSNSLRSYSLIVSSLISILLLVPVVACSAPAPAAPAAPVAQTPAYTNPKLGVAPLTIDVIAKEGQSATQKKSITIANEGEGVMIWAARKTSASWLWMNEADGALEKGYTKALDIFISPSAMTAGTYTEKINVEGAGSRNSPQTVVVTLKINPADVATGDAGDVVVKKPTPPPPWDYNEYKNDTYNFRLRYPKDYSEKQIIGWNFGAVSNAKQQGDTILISIQSSYGLDYKSAAVELTKSAVRGAGGTSRSDPKVIADDNTTTLADGATHAYELLYEVKSTAILSYQCYLFGTQKGSRLIYFAATAPLPYAADRLEVWKQIAHTLEFID
jgi:hypothetical protein